MHDIRIIENVFPKDLQDFFEDYVTQNTFAWFYQKDIATDNHAFDDKNYFPSSGFTHVALDRGYVNSGHFTTGINLEARVVDLAEAFNVEMENIIRVKLNLTTPVPGYQSNNYCSPHTDFEEPHWVFLYYINDSDGDTIFFNNSTDLEIIKRVTPKKGTAVLFDGKIYHTQSNPITSASRINMNVNVFLK